MDSDLIRLEIKHIVDEQHRSDSSNSEPKEKKTWKKGWPKRGTKAEVKQSYDIRSETFVYLNSKEARGGLVSTPTFFFVFSVPVSDLLFEKAWDVHGQKISAQNKPGV